MIKLYKYFESNGSLSLLYSLLVCSGETAVGSDYALPVASVSQNQQYARTL